MRHSRKSTRVISLINQLQPGINVNEENQPVTRGGRGEEEERRKRREPVAPCFLRRVNTHWIDSMGHFFSLLLLFFFPRLLKAVSQHGRRTSSPRARFSQNDPILHSFPSNRSRHNPSGKLLNRWHDFQRLATHR